MLGYEQRHEAGPRGSHRWPASRIVAVLEEMGHLLERTMIAEDVFSQYYAHHLNDTYDVVDRIVLNGHEYVACQARKLGITFKKEGNCFTEISNAAGLAQVADALRSRTAIGRLIQVCERWIYQCTCYGLSFEKQTESLPGSRA